jgi:hypothetical protein
MSVKDAENRRKTHALRQAANRGQAFDRWSVFHGRIPAAGVGRAAADQLYMDQVIGLINRSTWGSLFTTNRTKAVTPSW